MKGFLSSLITFLLLFFLFRCMDFSEPNSSTDSTSVNGISGSDSVISEESSRLPEEIESVPDINSLPFEEYVEFYSGIINDFKTLINFIASDDFENKWNNGEVILLSEALNTAIQEFESTNDDKSFHWSNMIVELPNADNSINLEDFGYVLYDINGDTIPELFWVRNDHTVLALFTLSPENNEKTVLLDAFWRRYECYPLDDRLYTWGSGGATNNYCNVYELSSDGKLDEIYSLYSELNDAGNKALFYENCEEILEPEFYELSGLFPKIINDTWLSTTIIPLI